VTIGEVLAALGEPLFDEPGYCNKHAGTETEGACVHHAQCNLKELWQSLEQWMRRALEQITLADALHQGPRLGERIRARLAEAVAQELTPNRIPLTTLQGN
jgi:DNA-binding IscR family transcriptional regulator